MTPKNVWVDSCVRPRTGARGSVYIAAKSHCIWATSDEICAAPLIDDEITLRHCRVKYIGPLIWIWALEFASKPKSLHTDDPVYSMQSFQAASSKPKADGIFLALKSDGSLELFAYIDDSIILCSRATLLRHSLQRNFKYNGDAVSDLVAIRPGVIALVIDGNIVSVSYAGLELTNSARCRNITDAVSIKWEEALMGQSPQSAGGKTDVIRGMTKQSSVLWDLRESYARYTPGDNCLSDSVPFNLPGIFSNAKITCVQKHPDDGAFYFLDNAAVIYIDKLGGLQFIPSINVIAHTAHVLREVTDGPENNRTLIVWITSRQQGSCVLALKVRPRPDVRQIVRSDSQMDPCADFLVQNSGFTICGGKRSEQAYICKITSGLLMTPLKVSENPSYNFEKLYAVKDFEGTSQQLFLSRNFGAQLIINLNAKNPQKSSKLKTDEPTKLICYSQDMTQLYQITETRLYYHIASKHPKENPPLDLPYSCDMAMQVQYIILILSYLADSTRLTMIREATESSPPAVIASFEIDDVVVTCVDTINDYLILGTNHSLLKLRISEELVLGEQEFVTLLTDVDVKFVKHSRKFITKSELREDGNNLNEFVLLLLTAQGSLLAYRYQGNMTGVELVDSLELCGGRQVGFPIVEKIEYLSENLILISTLKKSFLLNLSLVENSLREALQEDPCLNDIRSLVFLDSDEIAVWLDRQGRLHQGVLKLSDRTNQYSLIRFESPSPNSVLASIEEIDEDCFLASTAPGLVDATSNLGFTVDKCCRVNASELLLLKSSGLGISNTLRLRLADNEIIQKICSLDLLKASLELDSTKRLFGICTQFADGKGKVHFIAADSEEMATIGSAINLNDAPISMIALNAHTIVIIASERIYVYSVTPRSSHRSTVILPPRTGFVRASCLATSSNIDSVLAAEDSAVIVSSALSLTEISQRDLRVQVTDIERLNDEHVILSTLLQSCVILRISKKGAIEIAAQDTPFRSSVLTIGVLNNEIFVSSRERKQIGLHMIHRSPSTTTDLEETQISTPPMIVTTELYPLECQINKFRSAKVILPFNQHQELDAIYWLDIEGNVGIIAPIASDEEFEYLKSLEILVFTKADLISPFGFSSSEDDFRVISGQFISVLLEGGPGFQEGVFKSHIASSDRFLDWREMMRDLNSIRQSY